MPAMTMRLDIIEKKTIARGALLGAGGFAALAVAIIALGSGSGLIALPFEMWLVDQRLPVVFRIHMLTSAVVLLVLPVALATRHRPQLHRRIGWLLGAFVVAGGLTALPVAIFSTSSLAARAGFFTQGLVWMGLLAVAIAAIRVSDRARHAQFMLAMAAVTTGAVWFRILTGSAIAFDWPFEATYAVAAWAGWLVPLALVFFYRRPLTRWALSRPPSPFAARAG